MQVKVHRLSLAKLTMKLKISIWYSGQLEAASEPLAQYCRQHIQLMRNEGDQLNETPPAESCAAWQHPHHRGLCLGRPCQHSGCLVAAT